MGIRHDSPDSHDTFSLAVKGGHDDVVLLSLLTVMAVTAVTADSHLLLRTFANDLCYYSLGLATTTTCIAYNLI